MEFGKLLKRSWEITRKYRFLWWLGFLAILTEGGAGIPSIYNSGIPDSFPPANQSSSVSEAAQGLQKTPPIPPVPTRSSIVGATSDIAQVPAPTKNELILISVLSVLLILAFIILLYISYSAKAGLFIAAKKLKSEDLDSLGFSKLFNLGKRYAWKLFLLNLLIFVVLGLVAAVLIIPSALIISSSQNIAAIAIFVAAIIVVVLIIIALAVVISILQKITERVIVLEKVGVFEAIGRSIVITKKSLGSVLLTWFVAIGIQLGYGIVIAVGTLTLLLILFLIGLIFFAIFNVVGAIIFACLAFIGLSILLLVIASGFVVFTSSFWTLSFESLRVDRLTK